MPQLDLQFDVKGVDPSSLGFGENIHDAMTLLTKVTGDFNRPFAKRACDDAYFTHSCTYF